jgi:acyl carrier protein
VIDRTEITNEGMHQRLVEIFSDVFGMDLAPDTGDVRRSDVEYWDSVNHLRLVLELEQEFGVTLPDEDVLAIQSLQDAETVLVRLGA